MANLFFSYSHRDEAFRDEIETHFAMLKREGVIEAWHDRRIVAGEEWAGKIDDKLESADIILLLVSPYFLSSNYCYEKEMTRALERHEKGEACVIPVIVNPCDWKSAPFGKLQAATKDAKEITKYPNPHDAYLEIAQAVRAAATKLGKGKANVMSAPKPTPDTPLASTQLPRSSNLRVKKTFTEHDRDSFLESSFEYVARFFEGSLGELQKRNDGITGTFRRINANHFTAKIYRDGKTISQCGIRLGGMFGTKQILFCSEPDSTNSHNEALEVVADGHMQGLRATMGFGNFGSGTSKTLLSEEGAAELYWAKLIEPLQR